VNKFIHVLAFFLWFLFDCTKVFSQATIIPESEIKDQTIFIEAYQARIIGDYPKAIKLLKTLNEKQPNNAVIFYELALNLESSGNSVDAYKMILQAVAAEPQNEHYYAKLLDILEKQKRYDEICGLMDKIIPISKDQKGYRKKKAIFCGLASEYDAALKSWSELESLYGPNDEIFRARHDIYLAKGDKDKALIELEKLNAWRPQNVYYLELLAFSYDQMKKSSQAEKIYEQILALDPNNSKANLALASKYKEEHNEAQYLNSISFLLSNAEVNIDAKMSELVPILKKFIQTKDTTLGNALGKAAEKLEIAHPKEGKAFAFAGDIYLYQEQKNKAMAAYEKAIQLNSNIYPLWENYLVLLIENEMFGKANKQSDLAIESFPNQASLYFFNAYAQYKIGRLELALSTIDQGLIMTSQKPDLKAQFLGIQSLIFLELEKNEQAGIAIKESQILDKNCTFTILASSLKEMLEKKDNGLANDILKNVNNPKFKGLQDSKLIHALALFYTKNFPAAQKLYSDLTRNPDFVSAFWFEKTGDAYALGNQSDEALKFWNKAWKLKQNAKLDQKIKAKKYLD